MSGMTKVIHMYSLFVWQSYVLVLEHEADEVWIYCHDCRRDLDRKWDLLHTRTTHWWTSQITTEYKSFQSVTDFTNRCFIAASNCGCFSSHGFSKCPRFQLQYLNATAYNAWTQACHSEIQYRIILLPPSHFSRVSQLNCKWLSYFSLYYIQRAYRLPVLQHCLYSTKNTHQEVHP